MGLFPSKGTVPNWYNTCCALQSSLRIERAGMGGYRVRS